MSSLDFVMMNGDGSDIQKAVPLLEHFHEELMSLLVGGPLEQYYAGADRAIPEFPLLSRAHDYYGEVSFDVAEFESLELEVQRIVPRASAELALVLEKMVALIHVARSQARPILVLPD